MRKRISIVIVFFCLFLCMNSCANESTQPNGAEIFSKLSASTVEVHAESDFVASLGSGFYIDEIGTVVTNYHVIQDCSDAYITTNEGHTHEVTSVIGYSKEVDVAILSTTTENSSPVEVCTSVTTGEPVYVLGSSLGLTGTFSEGLVSAAERDIDGVSYIQISAPISHGNSGGPVSNSNGEVIGIASAGFEEGQNLNLALPISVLDQIAIEEPITMRKFFEKTSVYYGLDDRIIYDGSTLGVRIITVSRSFLFDYAIARWELAGATEASVINVMDGYGRDQGGGALRIIDPGNYSKVVDEWLFDPARQPGDYALIENEDGCTFCYISILQPD